MISRLTGESRMVARGWTKMFPKGISPSVSKQQGTTVPSAKIPNWALRP